MGMTWTLFVRLCFPSVLGQGDYKGQACSWLCILFLDSKAPQKERREADRETETFKQGLVHGNLKQELETDCNILDFKENSNS